MVLVQPNHFDKNPLLLCTHRYKVPEDFTVFKSVMMKFRFMEKLWFEFFAVGVLFFLLSNTLHKVKLP